jgi:hypothetical protein
VFKTSITRILKYKIPSFFLAFGISSGISIAAILFSFQLYYGPGWVIYGILLFWAFIQLPVILIWVAAFIFGIILAFKMNRKQFWLYSLISMNVIGVLSILFLNSLLSHSPIRKLYSPKNFSYDELKNYNQSEQQAPDTIRSPDSKDMLAVYYKESEMSFGSGHTMCALYNSKMKLIDEFMLGAFPLSFTKWESDTICFLVGYYSKADSAYVDYWIHDKKSIGRYKIRITK